MMPSAQTNSHELVREAAARLVRAHNVGLRPEDDLTLSAWRRESHAHESAFRHAVATWEGVQAFRDAPGYADLLGQPTWRERWVAARHRVRDSQAPMVRAGRWAAACVVIATVAVFGIRYLASGPDYTTQVAETREIRLEDGSVVALGARSDLDVDFDPSRRRVHLRQGEAFFSVTSEASRPFEVVAGDTLIRVIGTRFNVNFNRKHARVAVEEGVVQVLRVADGPIGEITRSHAAPLRLTAGEQVVIRPERSVPQSAEPLPSVEVGSWRQGRLSYRDAALAEVVADINRYSAVSIRIAAPELGEHRITTSFRTTQIDQMLNTLPGTLPLLVLRHPDGSVDLEPRPVSR